MKKTIQYLLLFLVVAPFYAQTIPSYYNGLDLTKTGNNLFLELSGRLESTHTGIPYTDSSTDTWDVLSEVDEDPLVNTNVLLIYGYNDTDGITKTDRTRNKSLTDNGGGDVGRWNREHVFAKSLATPSLVTDEPGPGTDVHNLRPADAEQNTARLNRKFTEGSGNPGIVSSNGGWYPGDEWKGDVARIVMYMYVRYNGDGSKIAETQCLPTAVGFGAGLAIDSNMIDLFLKWNVEDPVSDFEDQRNPVIEGIQGNRNPFIDNPYLATLIWGGDQVAEDRWDLIDPSDIDPPTQPTNVVASNIEFNSFELSWAESTDDNTVIDYLIYLDGVYLQTSNTTTSVIFNLTPGANHNITIKARDGSNNLSVESEMITVKTKLFTLPSNNFKIETVGETCPTKANGKLVITALETNSYKATINGTLYTFTNTLTIENLAPKTYDFCILVEGQTYQQCYATTIEAGKTIGGKASVTSNKVIIDITEGTAPFNVLVNGTAIFQTLNSSFSVDALQGDLIQVKTSIDCEGVFAKEIDLFESITAYPNPTKGIFEIGLPFAKKEVIIELYNMQSQLISSKTYAVNYGKAQLNIEELPRGLYLVKVKLNKPVTIKIVKH